MRRAKPELLAATPEHDCADRRPPESSELAVKDQRIKRAIALLTNKTSTVASVARDLNLSVSRFRHLFKQELHVSPSRYVKNARLHRAKSLIEGSFLRIKEVASMTGVNDVSHFVRDYKAYFGQTPSEARYLRALAPDSNNGQQIAAPANAKDLIRKAQ